MSRLIVAMLQWCNRRLLSSPRLSFSRTPTSLTALRRRRKRRTRSRASSRQTNKRWSTINRRCLVSKSKKLLWRRCSKTCSKKWSLEEMLWLRKKKSRLPNIENSRSNWKSNRQQKNSYGKRKSRKRKKCYLSSKPTRTCRQRWRLSVKSSPHWETNTRITIES